MKKSTVAIALWVIVFVVGAGLLYDISVRRGIKQQTIRLVENANERLKGFFDLYENDKNKIGFFKANWKNVSRDSTKDVRSMEYVYEKSQSLRERIDAFRQEMIGNSTNENQIFLDENAQNLLKDSLQAYHYNIVGEECKDCNLGSDAYSEVELDFWKLNSTLPFVWNTALLGLEAKTWLLQHRAVEYRSKNYLTSQTNQFPYLNGKIYVNPEFKIVEEGKRYMANVFYGMSLPILYNYLSMETDFQKVYVDKNNEGRIFFTTWTSSYDETGEFHKTWEGDVYIVNDYILLQNSLQFKDTTINVEDDYMLVRDMMY